MAKNFKKGVSLFLVTLFLLLSASCVASARVDTPSTYLSSSLPTSLFRSFGSALLTNHTPSDTTARQTAAAKRYQNLKLYPGGIPFGVKFLTEGVLIVGFHEVKNSHGSSCPSEHAGLRCNDMILRVNGTAVMGAEELQKLVEQSGGKPLEIIYSRGGAEHKTTLTPSYCDAEGRYSTGIYVRDSGAGIGTVTFILPDSHAFAGLGHGICDGETGALIPMQRGSVVHVTISGVVRGLSGTPGEVRGYFSSGKIGTLLGNSECGVWGVLASQPEGLPCEPLPIGLRSEVKEGRATIYCTLDDNRAQAYEIEISEIRRDSNTNKCFTVKITDEKLISKTGGIIQGMSGSPIIQNGKIVGAVTHVLINDPTTGYGIFIENMLNQMGDLAS